MADPRRRGDQPHDHKPETALTNTGFQRSTALVALDCRLTRPVLVERGQHDELAQPNPRQPAMTLTDSERTEIRALLEEMRTELEDRIEKSKDLSQPVQLDEPIGRLTRMDAMQMQHMAMAGLSREQERYVRVCLALQIIDTDDFGSCQSCKRPIGIDRLLFQPEIMVCVHCA